MKKWDGRPYEVRRNQFLAYRSNNFSAHNLNTSYSYPRPCASSWKNMTGLDYTVGDNQTTFTISGDSPDSLNILNSMNEFTAWMFENGTIPDADEFGTFSKEEGGKIEFLTNSTDAIGK